MTLFELAATDGDRKFCIGKSKIIWECATVIKLDKVRITRVVKSDEGGKPFIMGLNFKMRYANPDSTVQLIFQDVKP